MNKREFPAYAFCDQKRYLRRHLVKPRSMKLHNFPSRLQKLNAYLEEFPPDTEGQENAPLSEDEIMDIIYHSMSITWKNKMIEQCVNYADSTIKEISFKLEKKSKEKKRSFLAAKQSNKKSLKNGKWEDFDSNVVESNEESSVERHQVLHPTLKMKSLHG